MYVSALAHVCDACKFFFFSFVFLILDRNIMPIIIQMTIPQIKTIIDNYKIVILKKERKICFLN